MSLGLALTAASVAGLSAQNATAQQAADFSSQKLDAFTVAYLQVIDLREQYAPVLQAAETEEQQQAIIEEANGEMIDAIEGTEGMTLEDYESIAQAATEDEALSARIMARVEEMAQSAE
jgi:hypothetical protein